MSGSSLTPLSAYKDRINQALEHFFAGIPGELSLDLSGQSLEAIELLREYSLRPGKRIRGSLAAASYDSVVGTQYGKPGIQLGVAAELIQNYLLIVDDVMDKSELRRGRQTIHESYFMDTKTPRGKHEANMQAINVGLLAQHFANLALLGSGEQPERITDCLSVLHRHISATGFGQIDDLHQQVGRDVTADDIIRKYCLKSSHYTFINPLHAGMILAGRVTLEAYTDIYDFGRAAGIAFQLRDDYLGLFGNPNVTGKAITDDIKDKKYTLLMHYVLEHANDDDVRELTKIMGKTDISESEITEVQRIGRESGAQEYILGQIDEYTKQAGNVLQASGVFNGKLKEFLQSIVAFSARREA